jgi:hypothetical protein
MLFWNSAEKTPLVCSLVMLSTAKHADPMSPVNVPFDFARL